MKDVTIIIICFNTHNCEHNNVLNGQELQDEIWKEKEGY